MVIFVMLSVLLRALPVRLYIMDEDDDCTYMVLIVGFVSSVISVFPQVRAVCTGDVYVFTLLHSMSKLRLSCVG